MLARDVIASINSRMSEMEKSIHCAEEETEAKRVDLTLPKPHNTGTKAGLIYGSEFLPLPAGKKGITRGV